MVMVTLGFGIAAAIFAVLCVVGVVWAGYAAFATRERYDESIAIKWAVVFFGLMILAAGGGGVCWALGV
jgi:hypothetical protein